MRPVRGTDLPKSVKKRNKVLHLTRLLRSPLPKEEGM